MTSEHDYFGDARFGKLFDLVLQLATDLHVTRQRLRATEALLVRAGVVTDGAVDGFVPSPGEKEVLDRDRDELLRRLIRILTESGPAEHPLRD
jgi:hypothetical protein